jgi:hypothetical protein
MLLRWKDLSLDCRLLLICRSRKKKTRCNKQQQLVIRQLRRQLRSARQQVSRFRAVIKSVKHQKPNLASKEEITEAASKFLKKHVLDFFACQLRSADQSPRRRRWLEEDKLLALSLFHRSPAAYRLMASYFTLPSVRSLRRWLEGMRFEPGFCDRVFETLKCKVDGMSDVDRMAVLCVDEVAIKLALDYDRKRDIVDGFVDDGVERIGKPASEALVFHGKRPL